MSIPHDLLGSGEQDGVPYFLFCLCLVGMHRVFLKILGPVLPQRITTLIVEFAWNPFRFGMPQMPMQKNGEISAKNMGTIQPTEQTSEPVLPKSTQAPQWGLSERFPPHILTLPPEVPQSPAKEDIEHYSRTAHDASETSTDVVESESDKPNESDTESGDGNKATRDSTESSTQKGELKRDLDVEEILTS